MTYKEAINRILTSIGENPIDSEPSDNIKNPTVSIILRSIQDISKQLQNRGYWFNTRYVELQPNFNKQLIVPDTTINWVSDTGGTYLLNNKLACSVTGSTYFDSNIKEKGKVMVLVPFEDLPESFAQLVTHKSNMESYLNTFGVDEHYKVLMQQLPQFEEELTADVARFNKYNTRQKPAFKVINQARFR